MVISILVFSIASSALLAIFPGLETIRGTFGYRMLMIVFKLLLLPVVVGITYEINRWCGRHDNAFTRVLYCARACGCSILPPTSRTTP